MLDMSCVTQISVKRGTGVDDLLETVALVAEVEQLTATSTRLQQTTASAARPKTSLL